MSMRKENSLRASLGAYERSKIYLLSKLWFASVWMAILTVLFILPLEEYGELQIISNETNGMILRILIYGLVFLISIGSTYFTGRWLDFHPYSIKTFVLAGLGLLIFGLVIFAQNTNLVLIVLGFFLIAIGAGALGCASIFTFAGYIPVNSRGKHITHAILIGSGIPLITVLIRSLFVTTETARIFLYQGDIEVFLTIVVLTLFLIVVFFFSVGLIFNLKIGWENDKWPTAEKTIFLRRPVIALGTSHILVYMVFGISIALLLSKTKTIFFQHSFFKLNSLESFWFFLLVGELFALWFWGQWADHHGRKSIIIISIYIISVAFLGFTISLSFTAFLLTSFFIGVGYAAINVSLDSTVWMDLSPRDALGRYLAIGLITLIAGLALGRIIGLQLVSIFGGDESILGYAMLFVASISIFPITQIDDTYPPLDFLLLLVRKEGGLLLYANTFGKFYLGSDKLLLISGGLEAVDSFMNEILRKGKMEYVRHAGYYILNDRIESISVNLITNKAGSELRSYLRRFTVVFYEKYKEEIERWVGTPKTFEAANELVEEIFGPLIPSRDI